MSKKPKPCQHRRRIFVPHQDDPRYLADICISCQSLMGWTGPGDPELELIGDSLGDPEGDDEWDDLFPDLKGIW
jgi:hypothetical protein